MKICFLADGQSIHTKRWCDHFSKAGQEVHLITFRQAKIENTRVHFIDAGDVVVAGGNWKVLLKTGKVKKILREIKPDLLHAHYATSYGIVGALTGFHPYIITGLGTDLLISPGSSFLYRMLIRYALKRADWITVMSEQMQEAVMKLLPEANKLSIVRFGIDPEIFHPKGRNVPTDKFVITSTRNFEPVYNIELLLNALGQIKTKISNLSVNLIGAGTLRSKLEKMTIDLGLSHIVKFHGKLQQPEIANILRQSHLFATTSLSDGNNVSLNEAMACGTVAIATDIAANREWVRNEVNGFLVPTDKPEILAEKIVYVYNNYPELERKTVTFNEKIIAEKALWQTNMAMVGNKYRELCQKSYS